ncbi:DUF1289 domain-containing protein [Duganella sp. FT94W]|uniref:DUF1289 domain-containing protein n=1 Tax=Duganella lactea TaxID=2692173 RepID=A0ABW9V2T9_9BURK|nr:DUF1289 domain-containing protein [Duganella lactea]MYM33053.1 DUF1289 domain-containing protein [Duganella lactea]
MSEVNNISPSPLPSPCVSLCKMDPERRYCMGCLRSIEEIIAWGQADDEYKRAVWAELPRRRATRRCDDEER